MSHSQNMYSIHEGKLPKKITGILRDNIMSHSQNIYSIHEGKVPKNYWNIERQHNEPVRIYIAFMKENFQKITGIVRDNIMSHSQNIYSIHEGNLPKK